jgi:hypothetical protein
VLAVLIAIAGCAYDGAPEITVVNTTTKPIIVRDMFGHQFLIGACETRKLKAATDRRQPDPFAMKQSSSAVFPTPDSPRTTGSADPVFPDRKSTDASRRLELSGRLTRVRGIDRGRPAILFAVASPAAWPGDESRHT